jgi:hypothetical protein
MIFNKLARFVTLLGICLIFTFCGSDEDKKNIPDVSDVVTNTQFLRFDQDLFAVKTLQDLDALNSKYGKVSEVFFKDIIGAKKSEEGAPQYFPLLQKFLTDTFVRKTYDTTQLVFKNFEPYKKELTQAARFYKHYFPNSELTFIPFVSQYNYDVFPFGRDTIGIGLDGFLGANHPDYFQIENLSYEYVRRTMAPQYLSTKAMRMVIAAQAGSEMGNRLLDMMIHNGKQLYILDQLLPETPDSIKFGYSAKQTQWCKNNEVEMWASLLKANLLYETNGKKIAKLVSPSPSSPGMPPESPGETGNYLGWQIVKQFMKRNPNTTLPQLLAMRNAQEILDKGKYKPKR